MYVTNGDRTHWATQALDAFTAEAPASLLPFPAQTERVRLGIIAAEALARATRWHADEQTVTDEESAEEIIGDLMSYSFLLVDGQVTPDQLTRAADEMRSTDYPVMLTAVCEVSAPSAQPADRVAAMLAACIDAAESFGCDVTGMLDYAKQDAEILKADERA
ncbi:hypothetical protein [Streptomyces microflavus]